MKRLMAGGRVVGATVLFVAGAAAPALAVPKPKITINDITVPEGNGGQVPAVFTVNLSFASALTVTMQYTTVNVTATAPADYVATQGTLSIPPGSTSGTITVLVNGDLLDEPNETFQVKLNKPKNATFSDRIGVATIIDDDAPPSISINDVTVNEGGGTTTAVFVVSLSGPSGNPVSVNFATSDGTATAGADYVAQAGALTFTPGTTGRLISVPVFGDLLAEPTENFFVNLSGAVNGTIADPQGVGTIIDDDALPTVSINDVLVIEGSAGTSLATFTVSLSAASGQTVTVDYATADGTATAGTDYLATSGTVTFPPGATTMPVSVTINGDTTPEPNETFVVNLSNPVNATVADPQGVGTIADDDSGLVLFIDDVTVAEGDAGTVNATFTVSLSTTSGGTVTVDFATADGTATAPADYASGSGTLTFPPGTTTQPVTVLVNGDLLDEADETFFVNLTNPTGATIADGQGMGTITDNDASPTLSVDDVSVTEADTTGMTATFTVTLSAPSGQTVTVNYGTADGTATAGTDYVAAAGILSFPPGTTTQTVSVFVLGDVVDEADETYLVNLTNPVNATIADGQGLGTILDNDAAPELSIDDVAVLEGDAGANNADFTVTLSAVSGQTVTVNFTTADGTATAPQDYTLTAGTLTFPPGTTTGTISVPIQGDVQVEPNETYFVNLSGAVNATIADDQGLGTILNDDGLTLIIDDASVTEGDAGTVDAVFTVTLSDVGTADVTVDYATQDGTATAPADYASASGQVLFPPGSLTQTITVQVQGDTLEENDETFLVNLSNPTGGATLADDQAVGTIIDDDTGIELSHGSDMRQDLASSPALGPDKDLYRIGQKPYSSYEVLVDSTSGDIGVIGAPVSLSRVAADGSTVLQAAQSVEVGLSQSLRWENTTAAEVADEFIRVQSAGCTTNCGPDDVYRIRAFETSYSIPRFNNAGSQITVLILQNPGDYLITGTAWFWSTGGTLLASQPFTLAARNTLVLNTAGVTGLAGQGGSVSLSHDGRYGDLAGKTVALEPATGFSFDSPMAVRPR